MSHYFCPMCKGMSEEPKVCDTEGCSNNGQAMQQCDCTDGMHQTTGNTPA